MKASDLATIVKEMTGRMPESSRHFLAQRILHRIGLTVQEKGANLLKEWQDSGAPAEFLRQCELKSGPPWVSHEIAVHDSDLATLINRWMNVERIRRTTDGEWEPLTADQNDIRCAIVEDLKGVWRNQTGEETFQAEGDVPSGDV